MSSGFPDAYVRWLDRLTTVLLRALDEFERREATKTNK